MGYARPNNMLGNGGPFYEADKTFNPTKTQAFLKQAQILDVWTDASFFCGRGLIQITGRSNTSLVLTKLLSFLDAILLGVGKLDADTQTVVNRILPDNLVVTRIRNNMNGLTIVRRTDQAFKDLDYVFTSNILTSCLSVIAFFQTRTNSKSQLELLTKLNMLPPSEFLQDKGVYTFFNSIGYQNKPFTQANGTVLPGAVDLVKRAYYIFSKF